MIGGNDYFARTIDDIYRDNERDDEVYHEKSREFDDEYRNDNTHITEQIGFVMETIGLDDKVVGFSRNAIKIDDNNNGKNNRYPHENEREDRVYHVSFFKKLLDSKESNDTPGKHDKKPLHECGKSFDLTISVVIRIVLVLYGFFQCKEVDDGDEKVEERVDRARYDCETPRHHPSDEFDNRQCECKDTGYHDRFLGRSHETKYENKV